MRREKREQLGKNVEGWIHSSWRLCQPPSERVRTQVEKMWCQGGDYHVLTCFTVHMAAEVCVRLASGANTVMVRHTINFEHKKAASQTLKLKGGKKLKPAELAFVLVVS